MRIAVVTPMFPTSANPQNGRAIYQTVLALQRRAKIEVYCLLPRFPRWRLLQPRTFPYKPIDPAYCPPGVKTRYIEYPALLWLSRLANGFNCRRRLRPWLEQARPDLVLAYWLHPEGSAAVAVARRLGLPVVLGARGSDLRRLPGPLARRAVRRALANASFVLAVSDDLRRLALEMGVAPGSVRTVRNGCDPSIFRLASRTDARSRLGVAPNTQLVLFVGRLVAVKGLRELLEAMALLAPSLPQLRLVCLGEGPLEAELRSRVAQPDLAGRVSLLSVRPPAEIAGWLAACDLLCLPSYSEGCPNVILEALACGRPVVASEVGGVPEMVGRECAILVPPHDGPKLAQGLAEGLNRHWDESAIARSFGRTWDDVARETFEVCLEALGAREASGPV